MDWTHIATGVVTAVVAITVIRRWRSHQRGRDIRITFDWHSRQRDDSKENHDDSG